MNSHTLISLIVALGAVGAACAAVTPAELRDRLARGDRVTIDLRPRIYEAGTLPNAIRMTAREATQNRSPARSSSSTAPAPRAPRRRTACGANSNVSADAWRADTPLGDAGGQTSEAKGCAPP